MSECFCKMCGATYPIGVFHDCRPDYAAEKASVANDEDQPRISAPNMTASEIQRKADGGGLRYNAAEKASIANDEDSRVSTIPLVVTISDPPTKPSNPKDALGILKAPQSVVPLPVIYEVGLGMLEGAFKYGRHNYRIIGVRGSVYYDATRRHLDDWWEGEDIDPASHLSHITKAISSLVVLRDAMIRENWVDDRPPPAPKGWMEKMNEHVKRLIGMYPNPKAPYTSKDKPVV